nr:immunoglobulin light chain junction region [Macaca mulatta]MOW08721.1 immunoglobulin light chain junction region [Macaca mulatta]MOW09684.1 immunoglobulin light chain junction region [Macaca mulatta]MOW09699.1 immunoglobulin light chain junction region [Macaca mulatta]MOW09989.1 immunoglobulin light chain junction region [Macaca mulatta]
CMQYTRIPFTF